MKLFKPQVQLVRKKFKKKTDKYYLHAVTFFDSTKYQSAGYEPIPKKLNKNGALEVRLLVKEIDDLPDFSYLTPIVHTVELGSLPFGNKDGMIEVKVYLERDPNTSTRSSGKKKVGGGIAATTSADNSTRPIGKKIT